MPSNATPATTDLGVINSVIGAVSGRGVGGRRCSDAVAGPFGIDRYSSEVPPDGTVSRSEDDTAAGTAGDATAGTAGDATAGTAPGLVVDLDLRSVLALLLSLFALAMLAALAREASRTLTWLAIGVLLALALNPVVLRAQERLNVRRSIAVGLVLTTFLGVVVGLVFLLGPPVVDQARDFNDELPQVLRRLEDLPIVGDDIRANDVPEKIENWIDELPTRLGDNPSRVADAGRSVLSGVLSTLAIVLITITLLLDGSRVVRGLRRVVPLSRRSLVDRAGDTFYRIVGRYFAGSLFVAALAGTGVLIMGVILGLPLTPVAALWTASTNLIPQIGGFLGGALFVGLGLTKGPTTAVVCIAYFLAYQQLENHVIQPVVVGEAVDLSPPATMLAALVGASAAGVPGALLATPLVGVIKALYLEVRDPGRTEREAATRRARKRERGRVARMMRALRRGRPRDDAR
jgi:predicted PurR-regulated permease PerM